jgi:3-hydroxyisobutyrate dehydrogenase-like beta-hydroxyacid dehydrogenase
MTVIALLHPGAMGSRVGGELVGRGHQVRWLTAGRSAATADRAAAEGLVAMPDLASFLHGADVVLSVCPPQGALDVAIAVATSGFGGTYVEANPISPQTLAKVSAVLKPRGAVLVDAGIVGPPPRAGGRTHLYLAGPEVAADRVSALFGGSAVTPVRLGATVGAASAAKQAYALYNKGRMVLAATAAELAAAYGVGDVLAAEGDRPGADVLAEAAAVRDGLAEVGWRWGPEFAEIGAAVRAAGLDPALVASIEAALRRGERTGLGPADGRG